MPSWNDLINKVEQLAPEKRGQWLKDEFDKSLNEISRLRDNRNVVFYASAFLQKPQAASLNLLINQEDINGLMSAIYGLDCKKGLTLIMHTPGGITHASETFVSYLRSKFPDYIEVIVPTYAMSAGTMISLSANRIVMGRQSQLGPIDPQMPVTAGRTVSALAIIGQFEEAKKQINADVKNAHVWAPILASLGPAVLQEAENAISYSEGIVKGWLTKYMFSDQAAADAQKKADVAADFFSRGSTSHGRRIGRDEARTKGIKIEDLEANQALQEAVLNSYHVLTIIFQQSPVLKMIAAQSGRQWIKNDSVVRPQPPRPTP